MARFSNVVNAFSLWSRCDSSLNDGYRRISGAGRARCRLHCLPSRTAGDVSEASDADQELQSECAAVDGHNGCALFNANVAACKRQCRLFEASQRESRWPHHAVESSHRYVKLFIHSIGVTLLCFR